MHHQRRKFLFLLQPDNSPPNTEETRPGHIDSSQFPPSIKPPILEKAHREAIQRPITSSSNWSKHSRPDTIWIQGRTWKGKWFSGTYRWYPPVRDRRQQSILIFLDSSAAVSIVDHEIVMSHLREVAENQGNVLKWFESFLEKCFQWLMMGVINHDGDVQA